MLMESDKSAATCHVLLECDITRYVRKGRRSTSTMMLKTSFTCLFPPPCVSNRTILLITSLTRIIFLTVLCSPLGLEPRLCVFRECLWFRKEGDINRLLLNRTIDRIICNCFLSSIDFVIYSDRCRALAENQELNAQRYNDVKYCALHICH